MDVLLMSRWVVLLLTVIACGVVFVAAVGLGSALAAIVLLVHDSVSGRREAWLTPEEQSLAEPQSPGSRR